MRGEDAEIEGKKNKKLFVVPGNVFFRVHSSRGAELIEQGSAAPRAARGARWLVHGIFGLLVGLIPRSDATAVKLRAAATAAQSIVDCAAAQ